MFKKTLLALAVASIATGAASAATMAPAAVDLYTTEGATSIGVFTSQATVVTLAAEYAVTDKITFTFNADIDAGFTPAASISVTMPDAGDDMTLGFLSSTANSLTYRVNSLVKDGLNLPELSTGGTLTLPAVDFDGSTVSRTNGVTINYSALAGLDPIDTGTLEADLITFQTQFSLTAPGVGDNLNGIIDVENDRIQFTLADATVQQDTLTTTTAEDVAGIVAASGATITDVTHVLYGSFAHLDTDTTATGIQTADVAAAGSATLLVEADKITATWAAVGAHTIVIDNATLDATLTAQTFTLDTTINYDDSGVDGDNTTNGDDVTAAAALGAAEAAGAWTLNGSQVSIPYMPYGTSISQIVYMMNEGAQTGASTLDGVTEDGTAFSCSLGNIAPGTTKLTGPIKTCVEAEVGAGVSQKVALVITTNVPATDVEVYSAYNVNSDGGNGNRVTVPNSSTHGLAASID